MRLDFAFRLSSYLTLGLASLSLGVAELPFIDGVGYVTAAVLALLAVSFLVERRWTLSTGAANLVGLLLMAVVALWIGAHVFAYEDLPRSYAPLAWVLKQLHEFGGPLLKELPFPVGQMPYFGLILMVAMAVETLRPKRVRDYFKLHFMGLLQVALGCVLAGEPLFAALLLLYLASGVWFLTLFYQQREHFACAPAGQRGRAPLPFVLSTWPSLFQAARWAVVIGAMAMLFFLATPRFGQTQWNPLNLTGDPASGQPVTGFSEGMDLNRTGRVEVNDGVAFTVHAEDAQHAPKLDLRDDQRWRGAILDRYESRTSRWLHGGFGNLNVVPSGPVRGPGPMNPPAVGRPDQLVPGPSRLPDLGPRQYYLSYDINPRGAGGLFLAEPVLSDGLPGLPVVRLPPEEIGQPPFVRYFGTLTTSPFLSRSDQQRYQQVTRPLDEPDLSPPVPEQQQYAAVVAAQDVPGMLMFTNQLLDRLAAEGAHGLTREDVVPNPPNANPLLGQPRLIWRPRLSPQRWERVARALTEHLARSGEYTYTLDLRRKDPNLDPTLDFLANVKQGHCERFASALALMLRSQGIPARIVKGFRGADHNGDGDYEVRHSHAHSWVEVLVPRPGALEWRWLVLDPTASNEAAAAGKFSWALWWDKLQDLGPALWRGLFLDYNSERQEELLRDLAAALGLTRTSTAADGGGLAIRSWMWLLAVLLVPAVGLVAWRLRRRGQQRGRTATPRAVAVAFYARLLAILVKRCRLKPEPAQTPREFAAVVEDKLPQTLRPLADLPAQVADLFYRVRFGHRALDADEQQTLNRRLDELDAALAAIRAG